MRDEALEPRVMRPAPIDAPALPALPERSKPAIDARRHESIHVGAREDGQLAVACQAAGEGPERPFELQCLDDFFDLPLRIARAQPLSPHHRLALEQADITRQQHPPLARRQFREFGVAQIVAVASIEPEQA